MGRTLIAACPPISADDLTVDQIAAPYLAADIYKRCLAQAGTRAYYVVCTDDHHNQVEATARELRAEPDEVAAQAREAIGASLHAYAIDVDRFGQHDSGYEPFVREFFRRLFRAGFSEVRQVDVLYESKTGLYPIDAWVRGSCPTCLDATCGGACESCGAPNGNVDLLGLDPQRYALRREPRLVLDLERFRPELERSAARQTHPSLARLLREQLDAPLAPFVLSTRGRRGVLLDLPELPDQRLHPAGEMYAAQMYLFDQAEGGLSVSDELVQFAGFGRAHRCAFVHAALAAAAVCCELDWPEPAALVTSQLQLVRPNGGARSVIWARELTDVYSPDVVRAYLALIGPEYTEAHFVRSVVESSIAHIAASVERLVRLWNDERRKPAALRAQPAPRDIVQCMQRVAALDGSTWAERARRSFNCIDHFARKAGSPRAGLAAYVPSMLALCLEPLCPTYAGLVRVRFPDASRQWSELGACSREHDLPSFESRVLA